MSSMSSLARIGAAFMATALVGMAAARADHRPVIAVPGHPDVPAVVDGVDASYSVVEGEWGLYRPGHVAPTVTPLLVGPPAYYPSAYYPGAFYPGSTPSGYYPSTGRRPRYGRLEVEPPPDRPRPPPAPSYRRSWKTESPPVPATEYPFFESPQVFIEAPYRRPWRRNRPDPRYER
jgi:hypothetical protein